MTIGDFELVGTKSVDEAAAFLAEHPDDARPIAGGTALVLLIKQRFCAPRYLVPLWDLPGLDGITFAPQRGLVIGAGVSLSTMLASELVASHYPAIVDGLHDLGNVRIRNAATIGGHLAHADPNLNLPPVLIGYGGSVRATGPAGSRLIPLAEFFVDYYETVLRPGELVTAVSLPPAAHSLGAAYLNFKSLSHADWPALGVAGFVEAPDGAYRVTAVVSGVSLIPLTVRSPAGVSRSLADLIEYVAERAFELAQPLTDIRGSAGYKRAMTRVFTARALRLAAERANLVRIER